jgi:hypothetical protein
MPEQNKPRRPFPGAIIRLIRLIAPCSLSWCAEYPVERTVYNNVSHRTFNILVETSNQKDPTDNVRKTGTHIQSFLCVLCVLCVSM